MAEHLHIREIERQVRASQKSSRERRASERRRRRVARVICAVSLTAALTSAGAVLTILVLR